MSLLAPLAFLAVAVTAGAVAGAAKAKPVRATLQVAKRARARLGKQKQSPSEEGSANFDLADGDASIAIPIPPGRWVVNMTAEAKTGGARRPRADLLAQLSALVENDPDIATNVEVLSEKLSEQKNDLAITKFRITAGGKTFRGTPWSAPQFQLEVVAGGPGVLRAQLRDGELAVYCPNEGTAVDPSINCDPKRSAWSTQQDRIGEVSANPRAKPPRLSGKWDSDAPRWKGVLRWELIADVA